jgi:hypothetical protein
MRHRRSVLVMLLVVAVARLSCLPVAAHAQPTADQVLTDIGLSASDKQRVLNGELVTADVPAVSERDLSFAIALLVKTSPEALGKQVVAGDLVSADAQVQAHGEIRGAGSLADFAGLKITSDEQRALASAKAGDTINLNASEIAALVAARSSGPEVVQQQLHKMLLARYQAYRTSGLAGIAPYDRGGGRASDLAADLRKASEAAKELKNYLPAFHAVLLGYPKVTVPQGQETFFWVKSIIQGKPTYVLTHVMAAPDGAARAITRRQYYASTGYNGEQSVAGFLPVQGGTVVVYVSHAFTDQVAGFGGSMKRSLGSSVMASKMKEILEAGRKKVGQ